MRINDIIQAKGASVVTAGADDTVAHLIELLNEHRIGAVVITDAEAHVVGVVGERDVVRALGAHGAAALELPIGQLLDAPVHTCGLNDDLVRVAESMTELRTRHVPVIVDGRLAAIVSIGDIVKHRIDQLQSETDHLVSYLHG